MLRETGTGSPYLDHAELGRALRTSRADAAWVGWGFVAEDPAFAELCAELGVVFVGPPPEAMRLLGAKIEAKVLAEQTGVPVAAWSGGPGGRRRGRAPARGRDRLPAHREVQERWRRAGDPDRPVRGRARGGAHPHAGGGGTHLRRPDRLHGAPGGGRPARRGAGHRRPARDGVGARCPGLLGAAAQPEGPRGVELAGPDARAGPVPAPLGDRPGEGRRLRRGRHGRVPVPARREAVHLPRGQHPAAGRASRDRGDHRPRHREAAAARRRGRPPDRRRRRRSPATPSRRGSTRRTPSRSSPPPPGGWSSCACRPARACAWTPAWPSAT